MTIATNPAGAPLTDADIQRIVNDGVKAGELSWIGFDKDALGFYTIPVLSKCHFQLAHLVARAALAQPAAALAVLGGWKLVPIEPAPESIAAMASSRAVDDEGEFPSLSDLIDFSGKNKTRCALIAAYKGAIAAAPEAPDQPAAAPPSDAVQLVVNVVKDASPMLRTSGYTKTADLLYMAVAGLAKQDAVHGQLLGAQFAAKQHFATVQMQAERIAALEAKCDLLAASLKQADGKVERLAKALENLADFAETCDSWQSFPTKALDDARAVLAAAGVA